MGTPALEQRGTCEAGMRGVRSTCGCRDTGLQRWWGEGGLQIRGELTEL